MEPSIGYFQLFCTTVIQMLVILNPPSAGTVILGVTGSLSVKERLAIARKVCIIGSVLLFVFAFFGQIILDSVFHISAAAFQVGGGLYLFTVGLSMASNEPEEENLESDAHGKINSMIITPLATPLLVGPGSLTATLVERTSLPPGFGYELTFYIALAVTLALVYVCFVLMCKFSKYLTPLILEIIKKLIGIALICIAASSIIKGIGNFLHS